ncbi:MAG: STAS/SEC14 domain-containing protein [Cyclobacteriaceae bacterium]
MSDVLTKKVKTQPRFALLKQRDGSSIHLDKKNGIVKITWVGIVDQETAREMIHTLAYLMKSGMFNKILMSRDDFTRFTDEANYWMRDFLLSNRYKFNYKISRIAGVTPEAFRANIFANFIKTALQVIFPGVKISNFEFEESAMEWLV